MTRNLEESLAKFKSRALGDGESWKEEWLRYCVTQISLQLQATSSFACSLRNFQDNHNLDAVSLFFDHPELLKQVFGIRCSSNELEEMIDERKDDNEFYRIVLEFGTRSLVDERKINRGAYHDLKVLFKEIDAPNCTLKQLLELRRPYDDNNARLLQFFFEYPVFKVPLWRKRSFDGTNRTIVDSLFALCAGLALYVFGFSLGVLLSLSILSFMFSNYCLTNWLSRRELLIESELASRTVETFAEYVEVRMNDVKS